MKVIMIVSYYSDLTDLTVWYFQAFLISFDLVSFLTKSFFFLYKHFQSYKKPETTLLSTPGDEGLREFVSARTIDFLLYNFLDSRF